MNTLRVELGERSYPIYIGGDLLGRTDLLAPHLCGRQALVVTNEVVAPLYLDKVLASLSGYQHESVILPDGEQFKTLDTVNALFDALLKRRFNRKATLIALGGGVVGDITGFAAACYQRGICYIQIPTTLLAQVDSSVGGKTGVNHPLGKNMIGAFHQPKCVIADTDSLATLDARQFAAGLAEVIKYGLIRDVEFYHWLMANMGALMAREPAALAYAIERSCRNKATVVAADEREAGTRALLNLGHTFGHAIETATHYSSWLHGEAIAVGMLMAADLSCRLGWLGPQEVERLTALLHKAQLPTRAPAGLGSEQFLELMAVDKKIMDGGLRLILLKGIGNAVISEDFDHTLLVQTLDQFRAQDP